MTNVEVTMNSNSSISNKIFRSDEILIIAFNVNETCNFSETR